MLGKSASFLLLLGFWQLTFLQSAIGSTDFIYLGGPPKGFVKYELETIPSEYRFQIIGSLNPPSLLVNGEQFKLETIRKSNLKEVHINGVINKELSSNTFYIDYHLQENIGRLVLDIHTGKEVLRAVLSTSTFFLDFPIKKQKVLKLNPQKNGKKVSFTLSGKDLNQEKIKLKTAVITNNESKSTLSINHNFDIGTSYLVGTRGGQVLNLPVKVKKIEFKKDEIQLSVEKNQFDQFPRANGVITGYIWPKNALLFISGKSIEVSKSGKFSFEYYPQSEYASLPFKVISKDKEFISNLDIRVPTFLEGNPWYYPEIQVPKYYFDINLVETSHIWHRDLNTADTQDKFKIEFGIGKKISSQQTVGLNFLKRDPYSLHNGGTSIQYTNDVTLGVNTTWYVDWGWYYGTGLSFQNLRGEIADQNCNFCENVDHFGFLSGVHGGRRFILLRNLEFYAGLEFILPITRMPYDAVMRLKFINFRMTF